MPAIEPYLPRSADRPPDDGRGIPPAGADDASSGRRQSKGAVDRLLAALRQDLASGVYNPRERLIEAELVERYATSRAAVREALIQLSTEGLVERSPNRGASVRGMTLDEAIEIAEVRRELETLTAARAAERATPEDRERITQLAESLRDAAARSDVNEYLALNARFHLIIDSIAQHATARAILDQIRNRPIDRFLPEPFRGTPPTASVKAHLRIAAAIAACDSAAAATAMHEHLSELIQTLRQYERRTPRFG